MLDTFLTCARGVCAEGRDKYRTDNIFSNTTYIQISRKIIQRCRISFVKNKTRSVNIETFSTTLYVTDGVKVYICRTSSTIILVMKE